MLGGHHVIQTDYPNKEVINKVVKKVSDKDKDSLVEKRFVSSKTVDNILDSPLLNDENVLPGDEKKIASDLVKEIAEELSNNFDKVDVDSESSLDSSDVKIKDTEDVADEHDEDTEGIFEKDVPRNEDGMIDLNKVKNSENVRLLNERLNSIDPDVPLLSDYDYLVKIEKLVDQYPEYKDHFILFKRYFDDAAIESIARYMLKNFIKKREPCDTTKIFYIANSALSASYVKQGSEEQKLIKNMFNDLIKTFKTHFTQILVTDTVRSGRRHLTKIVDDERKEIDLFTLLVEYVSTCDQINNVKSTHHLLTKTNSSVRRHVMYSQENEDVGATLFGYKNVLFDNICESVLGCYSPSKTPLPEHHTEIFKKMQTDILKQTYAQEVLKHSV